MSEVVLSDPISFSDVRVRDEPEVYVIYEGDEVLYIGMAGRNGRGSLGNRLRDHYSGKS